MFAKRFSMPAARVALFVVFFWFGFLKLLDTSPANPLVSALLQRTMPFISFNEFIICFGILEMIIGVLFLIPRAERIVILLLGLHMVTTFMPLVLLPTITWQGFLTPTLEGQYIIKNLVIIALALGIAANLEPLSRKYINEPRT
jgi:uncharacterized membrane protein YkgB